MTKIVRSALLTSAALVAFANAPKPSATPPVDPNTQPPVDPTNPGATPPVPDAAPAAGKAVNKRSNPELTGVRTDVPMPTKPVNNRGSKTAYDFDKLTSVGASFGVKNKTAKEIGSIVSNQNKKGVVPERDAAGNILYVMTTGKDAAGNEIQVPTKDVKTVPGKVFFAVDVDPATDPDGAKTRVFREA